MGRARWIILVLIITCVWGAFAVPARAITVCFDYVLYRVTGEDQDGIGAAALKQRLRKLGYHPFPFTNAATRADAMKHLKRGYVVFLGDSHVGVVSDNGIDHFLQVFGASGTRYDPKRLPGATESKVGGLYTGDTLSTFIGRRFSKNPISVEVWRR